MAVAARWKTLQDLGLATDSRTQTAVQTAGLFQSDLSDLWLFIDEELHFLQERLARPEVHQDSCSDFTKGSLKELQTEVEHVLQSMEAPELDQVNDHKAVQVS